MALDTIILDGDEAVFAPLFGAAIVVVQPGKIEGTGETTINGKKVCIEGDEKTVEIKNCSYISPPFVAPGFGTVKIQKLDKGQLTEKVTSGDNKVILRGIVFTAEFVVDSGKAAKMPPPANTLDTNPKYMGRGQFIPANTKIKAD